MLAPSIVHQVLGPRWDGLVMRALGKDPSERWCPVLALRDALPEHVGGCSARQWMQASVLAPISGPTGE